MKASRRDAWARWIAVFGGCGHVPVAPGTVGSAAGALLFLLLLGFSTSPPWWKPANGDADAGWPGLGLEPFVFEALLIAFVAVLTAIGIWAAGAAERCFRLEGGDKDDGRIVIDEVVGQLIALLPLPMLLSPDSTFSRVGAAVVTGFVLFRLFDVWKPGAIRWAERRFEGGWGVMADDCVAGVYAAILLAGILLLPVSTAGFAADFGPDSLSGLLPVAGFRPDALAFWAGESLPGWRVSEWHAIGGLAR